MIHTHRSFYLVLLLLLCAGVASAQTPTGRPPFGSFAGDSVDMINLGNLNVHLTVPIFHKAGRGLPFDYDLTYDSTVWTPVFLGLAYQWQPDQNWGWKVSSSIAGYITHNTSNQVACDNGNGPEAYVYTEDSWVYWDGSHTPHPFSGYHQYWQGTLGANCTFFPSVSTINNAVALDGSGYVLTVTDTYPNPPYSYCCPPGGTVQDIVYLYSRDGTLLNVPINPSTPTVTGSVRDRNGNIISADGTGRFYDTLSSTVPVLTVASSGPMSANVSYTAPSGAASHYQIYYTNYTVASNFGSGISEYKSSAAVPLVSSIVLPDNSRYTFLYESTPSIPASTACTPYTGTTCTTARLASVMLPTGGTISYSYYNTGSNNFTACTTGNNGIFSDGSASCLKRTTPDGTWTYTRTPGSGSATATLVTAPKLPYDSASNQTIIQFQGIYETQRDVYQGSAPSFTSVPIPENTLQTSNLLQETQTCYNGAAFPCTSTAINARIMRKSQLVALPNNTGRVCKHDYFFDSYGLPVEQDDYDYGAGAPAASPFRKLITVYNRSLTNNILDMPSSVTICNGTGSSSSCTTTGGSGSSTGTVVAQTTYNYDQGTPSPTSGIAQHASVSGARGNLTSINYPVSGLTSHFTYYD